MLEKGGFLGVMPTKRAVLIARTPKNGNVPGVLNENQDAGKKFIAPRPPLLPGLALSRGPYQ